MKAKLIFITGNRGKFLEAQKLLKEFGIELEQVDLDITEPQADSLEEVVRKCAEEALKIVKENFIIDDSGLFIRSLNGFPGVYSSYVYKTIGYKGILKLLSDLTDRSAYFMTALAYGEPRGELKIFSGRVDGIITTEARGENGFGFDPIFKPLGSNLTFAEMSIEEKNKFSHRAKALRAFASWFMSKEKNLEQK
ncbi:MAG: XTP/dITP diphosphatase [Thaumarchaeota archaeon]|jgi:XTP/dITP diphosphohydrolase|nr:XTP/dITP diphosphatase [Nitrososphaerota archaeon]